MKLHRLSMAIGIAVTLMCSGFPNVAGAAPIASTTTATRTFDIIISFVNAPLALSELNSAITSGTLELKSATAEDAAAYSVVDTASSFSTIARQLRTLAGVRRVSRDGHVHIDSATAPNDPKFTDGTQWSLGDGYGINAADAWSQNTFGSGVVVAVIDTGILAHDDLVGRTLPGYDFISDSSTANDGNGRDNNPTDPGDWNPPAPDSKHDDSCDVEDSSWHGTHVAGIIAANSDNSKGIAGIAPQVKILPVRVLGRCGGSVSDIAAAIRWSAGLSVPDVPDNPAANKARVINLSLGGDGNCADFPDLQDAINDATAARSLVVVAAGNDNADADYTNPASCDNVLTVAATDPDGLRGGYWQGDPGASTFDAFSNYGNAVGISAPGVDIISTVYTGATSPVSPTYALMSGTSQATPHVSATAALVLSVSSRFSPDDVVQILKRTATPFPALDASNFPSDFDMSSIDCSSMCGAGIVNAGAAVTDALDNIPDAVPPTSPANTAVDIQSRKIVVSWEKPDDEGTAPVSSYKVMKVNDLGTDSTACTVAATSATAYFCTLNTVPVGDSYTFYVTATSADGTSDPDASDRVSVDYFLPPANPTSIRVSRINNELTFSWTAPTDTGGVDASLVSYRVEGTSSSDDDVYCEPDPEVSTTSCTIGYLTLGADITDLKVYASNDYGDSDGATAPAQSIPDSLGLATVGAFTKVTSTASSSKATVNWTFNPTDSLTPDSFVVKLGTRSLTSVDASDTKSCTIVFGVYKCSQVATALTPGKSYSVTVTAATAGIFSPTTDPESETGDIFTSESTAKTLDMPYIEVEVSKAAKSMKKSSKLESKKLLAPADIPKGTLTWDISGGCTLSSKTATNPNITARSTKGSCSLKAIVISVSKTTRTTITVPITVTN